MGAIVSPTLTCVDEGDLALSSSLIGWQLAGHSESHCDLRLAGPVSLEKGAVLNDLLPLAGLDPMGNGLPEPCHRQREPLVTDHSLDCSALGGARTTGQNRGRPGWKGSDGRRGH